MSECLSCDWSIERARDCGFVSLDESVTGTQTIETLNETRAGERQRRFNRKFRRCEGEN